MKLREQSTDPKPLYVAMTAAELLSRPPKQWTIPGMLPATGVAVIYGVNNVGKTFIAIDLLAAIAEGGHFFGKECKARGVAFVGLEGEEGVADRVWAWSTHHGRCLPTGAKFILDQEFSLDNDEDVDRLAASIATYQLGESPVIFIDTLSAAMMGLEENSSADMGAALKRIRRLRKLTGGMVILIAHAGKDSAKGLRGSSKLPGDCDTIFQVKKKAGRRAMLVEKQRDAKVGDEWTFELIEVPFERGGHGTAQASCVVRHDVPIGDQARTVTRPALKAPQERLGPNERMVVDVLLDSQAHGAGANGLPVLEVFSAFKARYQAGSRHVKVRFNSAVASLVKAGRLIQEADRLRLP